MQTLGLSDSTPRTESRWRALFWPTIRNVGDLDYITRQGLWICYIVAAVNAVLSAFAGFPLAGAFECLFYFLAGVGVRQRDRFAGIAAFAGYLLSGFVLQRYSGNGFGVVRIIFLALLFANIRGNWLSARWASEEQLEFPPMRLNQTLADKMADQLPVWLWPKIRIVFYVIATLELLFLLLALFAPLP
ncbi:hypothetical protein [Paludibaculum fermentans]|uniref:Uncharacterized protein n=1 Tax=Paludibaculum fermentans TaxID=1473598 RepID=A0A7S7SLQ3_PALFE|nr:hypothetical protein [Paludibaculum fermentans]QOY88701.1 hypothetical protein IRI77_01695 [Paludibaculum fermentans]